MSRGKALVGVIMGSKNDWDVMRDAVDELKRLGIPYEVRVVSAHRTPIHSRFCVLKHQFRGSVGGDNPHLVRYTEPL
jgi:phosphoribosylcarboxyaminoimidazole (NCAIR) mutase